MYKSMRKISFILILAIILSVFTPMNDVLAANEKNALVIMTDFGLKDGAVSAMKGVAFGVDRDMKIFDLTHEIPNYDIWEGAYRFKQTASYWPKGTVFVGVVDPGVGTDRGSIVMETQDGYYFVGPDNGLFGLVAEDLGVKEVRKIDESKNRLKGSEKSYTFHGRDIFAYVGARLASGQIKMEDIGPKLDNKVKLIPYQKSKLENKTVSGNIPILDIQYGNVWSNIEDEKFEKLGAKYGDIFTVEIYNKDKLIYKKDMPYVESFGEVKEGEPLIYLNSLLNVSVALNMDNFSEKNKVYSGADWSIKLIKK